MSISNNNDLFINDKLNINRNNIFSELQKLDYLLKSLESTTSLSEHDAQAEQELLKLLDLNHSPLLKQLDSIVEKTTVEKPDGAGLLSSLIEGAGLSTLLLCAFAYPITISGAAATAATTISLGSLITGTIIFGSWFYAGRTNAYEFSNNLNLVNELYDDGIKNNDFNKLVRAENILRDMFCLDKNDKSLQRFFRWFFIPKESFALAHYIHAEIGLHLNKHYAMEEFDTAIKDTLNDQFARLIKLRQTALLLSKQKIHKYLSQSESNQQEIYLQNKITTLVQDDSSKIYFSYVHKAYDNIIAAINCGDLELTHYMMSKFLLLDNFEIIQQVKSGSDYIILFNFVKSLCAAEIYSNPLTKSRDQEKLKIEYINLLISCYQQGTLVAAYKQIMQQNSGPFNALINEIRTQSEIKLHEVKNYNNLPYNIVQKLITIGVKEDPKALLSETHIIELLNDTEYTVKSLHELLIKIVTDENFAKLQFADGKNWLHYLPRINFPFELRKDTHMAAACIIAHGISPYVRDKQHKTAFQYIPSPDHNYLEPLFRPSADGADFVGLDSQKESIYNFLQRPLDNPYCKSRLLLLAGPPGVGKTELTKIMAAKAGYTVLEFHGGSAEDKWVGGREARVREFFNEAINKIEPVVIFMDEIDSICTETTNMESNHGTLKDELSNLLQTLIDQLPGSQVVVIGTTNYLNKVKKAIRSRAGIPVHFDLPDEQDRAKIIIDKLRLIDLEDEAIIYDLAAATSSWSPRDIEKYLLDVQEAAERENRNILTAQDFESIILSKSKLLTKQSPSTLFLYNTNTPQPMSADNGVNITSRTRPSP